jgi:hypothetical protein
MTSDALKKSLHREHFKRLKRLNQKFIQLLSMKEKKPPMQFNLDAVLNLSPNELSQEEKQLQARVFNPDQHKKNVLLCW